MTFPGFTVNGQLVAAAAVLVDAIFGVLYALGVVHTQPDQGLVLGLVTVVFNAMAGILAYIQHSQAVVKATLVHQAVMSGKPYKAA